MQLILNRLHEILRVDKQLIDTQRLDDNTLYFERRVLKPATGRKRVLDKYYRCVVKRRATGVYDAFTAYFDTNNHMINYKQQLGLHEQDLINLI